MNEVIFIAGIVEEPSDLLAYVARTSGDSGGGDSGRGGEGGGAQAAFPEGPITAGEGGGDEADGSDTPKSEYDGLSI